ncbi:FecR domain-containing protein [Bradyrhizobium genosp. L]|uniref:VCBS domain-containing protein n=1 Tax=Bradyrhizobium genosp. L TaxID=83637 RepID=UPI0018A2AF85|nr:VCBS domain-containing protein [Bradyrhizobium genosp. L]QPF84427.1 FecR domain-containing protein [Bradyrhizobium genosp. L]
MNFVDKFDGSLPSLEAHARGSVHVDTVSTHAPADSIIVEDGQFLFTADFKRSGVDLVLSKDDHELVLHDYFKGEKRAALASPDGAHLTGDLVNALTGYTQYAQAGTPEPPKVIGHVTKLTGNATAIRNGVAIVLNQGDNVYKGDVVQAGSDSSLGLTFIDGTVFGLGSNAKMVLNEMIYDPNGSSNSSLMSLVQGTISFVAGQTAKHGDMKVDTPVATMGIRGTAVLVEIDFDVQGTGGVPPAKFQVLVEPDGSTGSYILFDKTTLNPIATVDQAGTQTLVNGQGTVSFLSSAQLSSEAQKIISDVFAMKFTDNNNNPNTKLTTNFTDSIVPFSTGLKLANGDDVVVTSYLLGLVSGSAVQAAAIAKSDHVAGAPQVFTSSSAFSEQTGQLHSGSPDAVSGQIRWVDINLGDVPTATASFTSFVYHDAASHDVTSSLTEAQKAAIKAVEVPLGVLQNPGNANIGSATWSYKLADSAFDFLAAGETLTLTYTARVDNNYALLNETGFQTITITITGTNDTPVVTSAAQTGAITELPDTTRSAAPDQVTGTLTFTDADLTDAHTVSITGVSVSGVATGLVDQATVLDWLSLGALTDATDGATGSRGWTFSAPDKNFDYLAVGETLTLTYTIEIDDGHGGVVTLPVTITITGTNDTPEITSQTQAAAIIEGRDLTGSERPDDAAGTVTFTDVDLSDSHSVTVAGVTEHGVTTGLADQATVLSWLTLHAFADSTGGVTGSRDWIFSAADKSFDYLAAGETLTLTYLLQVDDLHGGMATQPVTITITGTNDTPVITSQTQAATIPEMDGVTGSDKPDAASGAVTFTDVDLSDHHSVSIAGVTEQGVTSGIADQATVLSWLTLGTLGDSTNGVTGSQPWTFSAADKNFDYLAEGETLTLTYMIQVDDHHGGVVSQPVTITVTGTNDTPIVTSAAQAADVYEAADATGSAKPDGAFGAVTFTDADLSDSHTITLTGVTEQGATSGLADQDVLSWLTLGSLSDSTGGATGSNGWTFSAADSSFDYLALGETLTLTYTIELNDHHGGVVDQAITITIHGANDAPTLADVNAGTLTDTAANDSFDPLSGTLHGHDVDDGETATLSYSGLNADGTQADGAVAGHYGSLTVNADGTYTYVPEAAAINALSAGNYTDTFQVETIDAHGATGVATLTVDVTGANDTPTLADADAGTLVDTAANDSFDNLTGQLAGADRDTGDTLSYGVPNADGTPVNTAVAGHYGSLTVNPDGSYTYIPDAAAINALPDGTFADTFTVETTDAHGAHATTTLTVHVDGVNDAPVFTGDDLASTYAPGGGAVPLAGNFAASDIDNVNYDGGSLTATVTDGGHEGDTLEIVGNDQISVDVNGNVMFDADGAGSGAAVTIGTLIDSLNSLTVDLNGNADNAAIAALAQAIAFENTSARPDTGTRTVTFTLHDGGGTADGGVDSAFFTTTVDITNHLATFGGDLTGVVYEDEHIVIPSGATIANDVDSGTATVQDVDPGQSYFLPVDQAALTGTYGDFTFDADTGQWTYALVHDRVDQLAAGEVEHDTLTVTSADGTTQNITIDVHGTNDAPVLAAKDLDATYLGHGTAVPLVTAVSVSDVDSTDFNGGSLTASIVEGAHDGDLLSITGDQYISVSGTTVMYDADGDGNPTHAVSIGTLSDSVGNLSIDLNASATSDAVAHLIQAVQFQNTSESPESGQRTVEFALNDGDGTDHHGSDTGYLSTTVNVDQAPVISVCDLQVFSDEGGGMTIGGLSVSDADARRGESFSLNVTTDSDGSFVTPSTDSGSLRDINCTLDNGLTYHAGDSLPPTDKVSVTVSDGSGATDTVNFIFNVAGEGPSVTLQGTDGKDVIFATGYTDTLTGGGGADQFVFRAGTGNDTITDFAPGLDKINLFDSQPFEQGNTDSFDAWLNSDVQQTASGALIHLDADDSILLSGVNRSNLKMSDFILHPGG